LAKDDGYALLELTPLSSRADWKSLSMERGARFAASCLIFPKLLSPADSLGLEALYELLRKLRTALDAAQYGPMM